MQGIGKSVSKLNLKQIFKYVFEEQNQFFRNHEWIRFLSGNKATAELNAAIFENGVSGRADNFSFIPTDNPMDVVKEANARVSVFIEAANNPGQGSNFREFLVGMMKTLLAAFYCNYKTESSKLKSMLAGLPTKDGKPLHESDGTYNYKSRKHKEWLDTLFLSVENQFELNQKHLNESGHSFKSFGDVVTVVLQEFDQCAQPTLTNYKRSRSFLGKRKSAAGKLNYFMGKNTAGIVHHICRCYCSLLQKYTPAYAQELCRQIDLEKTAESSKYFKVNCFSFQPRFGYLTADKETLFLTNLSKPIGVVKGFTSIVVPVLAKCEGKIDPGLIENLLWLAGYRHLLDDFLLKVEKGQAITGATFYVKGVKTRINEGGQFTQNEESCFVEMARLIQEAYGDKRDSPESETELGEPIVTEQGGKTQVVTTDEIIAAQMAAEEEPTPRKKSDPIPWLLGGGVLIALAALS